MTTISHTFPTTIFATSHYEALPRQVIQTLKDKGIPVTGDWMIRGVEYGALVVTHCREEVVFVWNDLGEEPPAADDGFGLI